MSISSTQARIQYTQTTVPQTFTVPFQFMAAADLAVVKTVAGVDTTLVLNTDYTVSGGGDAAGTVTVLAGAATNIITIYRNADLVQPTEYTPNDSLPTETTEQSFDRLVMYTQQLEEQIKRAVRVPLTAGEMAPGAISVTSSTITLQANSVAALKAVSWATVADKTNVVLSGYYSPGDGGGGPIRYLSKGMAPGTYVDNGFSIIVPTGGDGSSAWLWDYSGPIDVKWAGAIGDGSTPDHTAIQALVNSLTDGGEIYISPTPNYYKVTSTIVGLSNIKIIGCGASGKIKNADASVASDISVFSFTNKSNISIENVFIEGTAKNISVADGSGTCVYFSGCSNVSVKDCRFESYTRSAAAFNSCASVVCKNNYCANGGANGSTLDIATYTPDGNATVDVLIDGNTCVSPNAGGVGVEAITTGTSKNVRVVNNRVYNKTKHGIYFYGGVVTDSIISNNTVEKVDWIGVYLVGPYSNVLVSNNTIKSSSQNCTTGLPFAGIGLGVGPYNAVSITGNTINSTKGYPGIRADVFKFGLVSGNTIIGDGTAPAGGAFGSSAISLVDAEDSTISGNIIQLTGAEGSGIIVQPSDGSTYYKRNRVINNELYKTSSLGIYLSHSDTATVSGNNIEQSANIGIYIDYDINSVVKSNICSNSSAGVADVQLDDTCVRTVVEGNKLIGTKATGKGINVVGANCTDCVVQHNDCSGLTALGITLLVSDTGTRTSLRNNKLGLTSMSGSFTLGAAATTAVTNNNLMATSKISLTPTNASAATLMGSNKALYVVSISPGSNLFTVGTASGASAAGTETFDYFIT